MPYELPGNTGAGGGMSVDEHNKYCKGLSQTLEGYQQSINDLSHKQGADDPDSEVGKELAGLNSVHGAADNEYRAAGCDWVLTTPPPQDTPTSITITSDRFCANEIKGEIYAAWKNADADLQVPDNDDYYGNVYPSEPHYYGFSGIQSFLGDPLAAEDDSRFHLDADGQTPIGTLVQYFERGQIVSTRTSAENPAVTAIVYGSIYLKYRKLGGVDGILGCPISDENAAIATPGAPDGESDSVKQGRMQEFQNGTLYNKPGMGTFEIHGPIRDRWLSLGGPGSALGLPTSDVKVVEGSSGQPLGYMSRFENGAIYVSSNTPAIEVTGPILTSFDTAFRKPGDMVPSTSNFDLLGFPVEPVSKTAQGTPFQNFERGVAVQSNGAVYPFTQLQFRISRFEGQGSGDIDLWVAVDITSSPDTSKKFQGSMPQDGDYDDDEHDFGPDDPQAPNGYIPALQWNPARGELVVNVNFTGMDSTGPFHISDNTLGTVSEILSADNLWGTTQPSTDLVHKDNNFTVAYAMENPLPFDPKQEWRTQDFWRFTNFKTPELVWTQFAQTFSDVDEDEGIFHPFDHLFYSLLYKGLAADGNCMGMCLESTYAQVADSLYSEPIYRWGPPANTAPTPGPDNAIIDEINIKHGYQVGDSLVSFVVDSLFAGRTHDPKRCFYESRQAYDAGDYPVIMMTSGALSMAGHVVRPYKWNLPANGGKWQIMVANPNAPWPKPDSDPECVIAIDPDSNTWTLHVGEQDIYSGGGGLLSGGMMYSVPFCRLSSQPSLPFWQIMGLIIGGVLIICGDDGGTQQISDHAQRTFYNPGGGLKTSWSDIVSDPNQRIPYMARVPGAAGGGLFPDVYFLPRADEAGTLTHDVVKGQSGSGTYSWGYASPYFTVNVSAPIGSETDSFGLSGMNQAGETVTITPGASKTFTIETLTWQGKYTITPAKLQAGTTLSLGWANCGSQATLLITGGQSVTGIISSAWLTTSPRMKVVTESSRASLRLVPSNGNQNGSRPIVRGWKNLNGRSMSVSRVIFDREPLVLIPGQIFRI